MTCRVLIPETVAGLIIGRGGENIKSMAAASGARLKLSSRDMQVAGVPERIVSISGTPEACLSALDLVYHKMQEVPDRAVYTHKFVYYTQPMPMSNMMMQGAGGFGHGYMPVGHGAAYSGGSPGYMLGACAAFSSGFFSCTALHCTALHVVPCHFMCHFVSCCVVRRGHRRDRRVWHGRRFARDRTAHHHHHCTRRRCRGGGR